MPEEHIDTLARIIWDYHHVGHGLKKSDCIIVLGSHDLRVAERGAQLLLAGWAPWLVLSGGLGRLTEGVWAQSEAEQFAEVALNMGVPEEKMLIENRSTNTSENIRFSRELLKTHHIEPHKIIAVQKPYMERRTLATFGIVWPEIELAVTSPQLTFDEYINEEYPKDLVINIMIGDLQRIMRYPALGYQLYQAVPDEVRDAYRELVDLGYTQHLIDSSE